MKRVHRENKAAAEAAAVGEKLSEPDHESERTTLQTQSTTSESLPSTSTYTRLVKVSVYSSEVGLLQLSESIVFFMCRR